MGVKGLTTYLRDNRHRLSYSLELKSQKLHEKDTLTLEEPRNVQLVVDGWSLIYTLYQISGEPWVYGGEYAALAKHVENLVLAWKQVGIRPTFVFDGPVPQSKYQTVISRKQENCVKPSNLFFRTSTTARATPRSLTETRIAPPLGYTAIVSTLLALCDDTLKVEFAEGEADTHIVALAAKLGAYASGKDSDFIVLNSPGYKGYVPLDEMVWGASVQDAGLRSSETSVVDGDDFEFQTVTRKKQKSKFKATQSRLELGTGPLPPESHTDSPDLSLSLTVYDPTTFASHISLPPALLPLLGALIGNDYAHFDFFRSSEKSTERVQRVADTLSSVVREAQSGNPKKIRKIDRGGQGSVMDVIGTTVERLLLWRDPTYTPASGQIDDITEAVVLSTLEYATERLATLFPDEEDASSQSQTSRSQRSKTAAEKVRDLYAHAYHQGTLRPRIMEIFAHGISFPTLFLEDPDKECCARSIGRPIRELVYKVIATGGGIPDPPVQTTDNELRSDEETEVIEDENELVDVVEESSGDEISVEDDEDDPLAALRGRLQRLSFSGVEAEIPDIDDLSRPETIPSTPQNEEEAVDPIPQRKVVAEYIRRGARIVPEEIEIHVLNDAWWKNSQTSIPLQLRPVQDRLKFFVNALNSNTPGILSLLGLERENEPYFVHDGRLLSAIAVRWILHTMHGRIQGMEEGNRKREREKEKWTRSEIDAFICTICNEQDPVDELVVPIDNRAVQLAAQALATLEAIGWFAEALLLVDVPKSSRDKNRDPCLPFMLGEVEKLFSGKRFHAALTRGQTSSGEFYRRVRLAATEGLEHMIGEEQGKKGKKERKEKREVNNKNREKTVEKIGMFGVLADLDLQ